MLSDVRRFELYYDSEESDPREDPEEIHERLQSIAETNGIEYERIDTAELSETEREEAYESALSKLLPDREYHVGNRLFTGSLFGGARPALLIHYGDGIDLYPHRNDSLGNRPVGIMDFLDELDSDAETDHSDYAALRGEGDDGQEDTSGSSREQDAGPALVDGIAARLRRALPI